MTEFYGSCTDKTEMHSTSTQSSKAESSGIAADCAETQSAGGLSKKASNPNGESRNHGAKEGGAASGQKNNGVASGQKNNGAASGQKNNGAASGQKNNGPVRSEGNRDAIPGDGKAGVIASDRDDGAKSPKNEDVVRANSRGDAQNCKWSFPNITESQEASIGKKDADVPVETEADRKSISDDEISRHRLKMDSEPLKKVSQSEIQIVKEFQEQEVDVDRVDAQETSSSSCVDARPATGSFTRSSPSSNSIRSIAAKLFVNEPSSSSGSSSPPKSPVLSDEEYEEYLPEAVEESAIVFGISQSASPVSSEESLVLSPVVETATFPVDEMVEKLPCGCVRESIRANWNQNDDGRFQGCVDGRFQGCVETPTDEKSQGEEFGKYQTYVDGWQRYESKFGCSVEKLVSLQSFGNRESRGMIENAEDEPTDMSTFSRTSSSLTMASSSSDELDFDEEMQIRELLELQEGVVAAEAALSLAAAEDEEEEESGKFSISDAWGKCLSCFKC